MRILFANEALAGGGGVETYLSATVTALARRGHDIALLHLNTASEVGPTRIVPPGTWTASVVDEGLARCFERVEDWSPDVVFSHNMRDLDVDDRLTAAWPTVKMMHGYFGTCVSGQKAVGNGTPSPCARIFGAACLLHYLPSRCGPRGPIVMLDQYRWARRQHDLFARYRAVVVASEHMRREYAKHGARSVHAIPLFVAERPDGAVTAETTDVLFLGRLTRLKGGRTLIDALAHAQEALGRPVRTIVAGTGPEEAALRDMARTRSLDVRFPGWVEGERRAALFAGACVLAVPSVWPEPFGLVGLEAAQYGVPSVAFDVGGINQWLHEGVNGRLVPLDQGADGFGRALASMLADDRVRAALSRGAREAAAKHTPDAHLARLEVVLDQARSGAS